MGNFTGQAELVLRPDHKVQLGLNPDTAIVLSPPMHLVGPKFFELLNLMRNGKSFDTNTFGVSEGYLQELAEILAHYDGKTISGKPLSQLAIHLHGSGAITRNLERLLTDHGISITKSAHHNFTITSNRKPDIVVLCDYLAHDIRTLNLLMHTHQPHLAVRVRDGDGIIGPLVLPGLTSCLFCADLHRFDRDPEWPILRAQIQDRPGIASTAVNATTAALAFTQLEQISQAAAPPETLNATLEYLHHGSAGTQIQTRDWPHHPICRCQHRG